MSDIRIKIKSTIGYSKWNIHAKFNFYFNFTIC